MAKTAQWARLVVQTMPAVTDPREMTTILTFSLRDLFGELEPHSCTIHVEGPISKESSLLEENNTSDKTPTSGALVIVKCPLESANQVRAAMTMISPPPYNETTLYRFDVLQVTTFEKS